MSKATLLLSRSRSHQNRHNILAPPSLSVHYHCRHGQSMLLIIHTSKRSKRLQIPIVSYPCNLHHTSFCCCAGELVTCAFHRDLVDASRQCSNSFLTDRRAFCCTIIFPCVCVFVALSVLLQKGLLCQRCMSPQIAHSNSKTKRFIPSSERKSREGFYDLEPHSRQRRTLKM